MRRPNTNTLIEIAQIRNLQRLASETRALRAAAELHMKNAALEAHERERTAIEQSWQESLRIMSPEITVLWSLDLQRQEGRVRGAESDAKAAEEDVGRRTLETHIATARHDMAHSLARRARRGDLERRDEIALQSALDRHIAKGREE